jgi:hypothetical protein
MACIHANWIQAFLCAAVFVFVIFFSVLPAALTIKA